MALQLTGPINMQDLATEFGGGVPHALSEYYRGGGLVPNASANLSIPTSGAISLGNFYGGTRRIEVTVTISSNQTNYVFNTAKVPGYVAGIMDVTFVINSGVILSASSTGAYAGNVDTSWAAGDTVRIINNGVIVGCGGAGGRGSDVSAGSSGAPGGPAFIAQRSITFTNNGTIAGGGGGGGGGQGYTGIFSDGESGSTPTAQGGGGGGGRSSAAANSAGGTRDGGAGTYSGPGAGGPRAPGAGGTTTINNATGAGGSGGGWGAAGAAGTTSLTSPIGPSPGPYGPGSGGASIAGNGNITWLATGTRLGAIG